MLKYKLFHATGLIGAAIIAFSSPTETPAQTREDSTAVARLILKRALQDARRQDPGIRKLAFLPAAHPFARQMERRGARLLELAADTALVEGGAVCPWRVRGQPEPRLELVVRSIAFSGPQATADVLLRCSAGSAGGGGFGWLFTYSFTQSARVWRIVDVIERAIT